MEEYPAISLLYVLLRDKTEQSEFKLNANEYLKARLPREVKYSALRGKMNSPTASRTARTTVWKYIAEFILNKELGGSLLGPAPDHSYKCFPFLTFLHEHYCVGGKNKPKGTSRVCSGAFIVELAWDLDRSEMKW